MPSYLVPPPQSCAVIRNWDARAIRDFSIPGIVLMENAGEGCVRHIETLLGAGKLEPPFHIVCGFGNNAGDGFVIARHLFNRGIAVEVHLSSGVDKLRADSDAGINLKAVLDMKIPLRDGVPPHGPPIFEAGSIVDAIFGSGLSRAVQSPEKDWIEAINQSARPVIAIDIPSGLEADTGKVLGTAVSANYTLTFVAPKLGFTKEPAASLVGKVDVVGISIPRQLLEAAGKR